MINIAVPSLAQPEEEKDEKLNSSRFGAQKSLFSHYMAVVHVEGHAMACVRCPKRHFNLLDDDVK